MGVVNVDLAMHEDRGAASSLPRPHVITLACFWQDSLIGPSINTQP